MEVPVRMVALSYDLLGIVAFVVFLLWLGNYISYRLIKNRVLHERDWDYNICCGTTDGGGINADIVRHGPVRRFELVRDVTRLPHPDGAFAHVLCSHTLEHVDDPRAMFNELRRVGGHVTVLIPPLWDLAGTLNPFEHRVIFLTFRSRHDNRLPPYISYAPGRWLQRRLGQFLRAEKRHTHGVRASRIGRLVPHLYWTRIVQFVAPGLWLLAAFLFAAENAVGFAVLPLAAYLLMRTQSTTVGAMTQTR